MKKILVALFVFLSSLQFVYSQEEYTIKKLEFNEASDDYIPQLWRDYLVFISNRKVKSFGFNYIDEKTNKRVINIIKSKINKDTLYGFPEIFSKNIISNHNDGPASFTPDGKKYTMPAQKI